MDCDRDKATRAKEAAENMFTARDIFGAMRFALEARNLFPALEGIIPMIVTFNVYISAMNKIDGETDWYGVLRVDPLADDDALRKQYRRLARMLHPDKNKSIGAEGAFNLVSQAWSILSDNAKRVAYNEKINAVVCTLSTECVDPPEQMGSNVEIQKETAAEDASKTARASQSNRFWTICHRCKSRYKCSGAHFNRRLVCLICHEPFFPVEIDRPIWDISRLVAPRKFLTNRQAISQKLLGRSPLPRTSGASSAAQAANVAQQPHEKAKRKRKEEHKWEEAFIGVLHVAKKGYFSPAKVSKALEDLSLSSHCEAHENPRGADGIVEASMTRKPRQGDFECCDISGVDDNFIAIGAYRAELQNNCMKLDIEEISRKLEELKADTDDSQKVNEAGEEYVRNVDSCDQDNIGKSEDRMNRSQATKPFAGITMAEMVAANLGKMSIDVPDTSVEAANEDQKEANVEIDRPIWELINGMGKPGDEKKGNDKVSME